MKYHPGRLAGLIAALALAGVALPARIGAQELRRFNAEAEPQQALRVPDMDLPDTTTKPRTYWLEGALILGGAFAVVGGAAGEYACENRDSGGGNEPCWDDVLIGIGIGVGTGASLGALLGGLIRKGSHEPRDTLLD